MLYKYSRQNTRGELSIKPKFANGKHIYSMCLDLLRTALEAPTCLHQENNLYSEQRAVHTPSDRRTFRRKRSGSTTK